MEARYALRKQQLLAECQVAPTSFEQVLPRLTTFIAPFVETFCRPELDPHAHTYLWGLLSDVERKNIEAIASRFGQDRLPLQRFIGWAPWEESPLRQELTRQVAAHLGHSDGVLVFAPSGFPQSGTESVGVARQWYGWLGQVDNCQVAVSLGYVSGEGHTLVAMRLYRPKAWTTDKARLDQAGVPNAHRGYRSRHQLALDMLQASGTRLPPGWIAGDDEMGRPYWLRRRLHGLGERYMLAVPGHTLIRDLEIALPASSGRGRPPTPPSQSGSSRSPARRGAPTPRCSPHRAGKPVVRSALVTGPPTRRAAARGWPSAAPRLPCAPATTRATAPGARSTGP